MSGKIARAKRIYNYGTKTGVVPLAEVVTLDEISETGYIEDIEIQSAPQAIMENDFYHASNNHQIAVDVGHLFLGNIGSEAKRENLDVFDELPRPFYRLQFPDRIHGFIKGWELLCMSDDLKACGWALNTEFSQQSCTICAITPHTAP